MNNKITTAVFPVAGMGTRFLPVTKAGPKEMLPIVDRPLIQYVVEEAIAVGITQLIFVTSGSKRAIEDYFDSHYELESRLEERGKLRELALVRNLVPENISIVYIRQSKPLGLGDAVLRAKNVVGDAAFAVLLADDIMDLGHRACLQTMINTYENTQTSVIATEQIPMSETDKYGIVSFADGTEQQEIRKITSIIEKPGPARALSNWAVTGRYILTPKIFELLENTEQGAGGEIQLTDAIAQLLKNEGVLACPLQGKRYDCGSPMGFLEATLAYAMKRPDLNRPLKAYLTELLNKEVMVD